MTHRRHSARTSLDLLLAAALLLAQLAACRDAGVAPTGTTATTPSGLADYTRWFGSLHAHTGMDGDDGAFGATAAQAFAYAANLPHLQYYVVTPHVHQSRSGTSLFGDDTYAVVRASAAAATTASFVAIAGQEISTIASGGHWNLYNAQALVGSDHPDGDWDDADDYYDHVAGLGAAGEDIAAQFNHPTTGDFGDRYDAAAAPYFGTFAVSSGYTGALEQDFSNNGSNLEYDTDNPFENLWAHYLGLGWKVSPAADQDNHEATWGASSSEYTVVVRPKGTALTPANVLAGLREHMTYATEDANMQIGFIANGWSMGQTIGGPSDVAFTIWWDNPSETIRNNNNGVAMVEPPDDAIQNIWIYKNAFGTRGDSVGANAGDYVAHTQPNTASGSWSVTLPAEPGDWFVVKFQDTYTFATDPTYGRTVSKDLTWSAPVWYDPAHADAQILVEPGGPEATPTSLPPTPAPTTPAAYASVVINEVLPNAGTAQPSEWIELYNPGSTAADIGGCVVDDAIGSGGAPYTIPPGTTIAPHGFWTLERTGYLNNSGDTANLIAPDRATVIDSYTFGATPRDESWYRLPDGGAWQPTTTSAPTQGAANVASAPAPTATAAATPTSAASPTGSAEPAATPAAAPGGPAVSYVQVPHIGATSALITWSTDVEATSQVEYGTSTDYGSLTPVEGALVTAHSVTLSDLAPATVYHYRVRSTGAGGVESVSADYAFKTLKQ